MTGKIFVVITMDVEPPHNGELTKVSGPKNWTESERFIRGYDSTASEFGFPVSYFLHPEVALNHGPLFLELEKSGACIDGLHLHPWKCGQTPYHNHLGGLSANKQRAAISEAIALYQHGIGRRPKYFRPGTFSGNDNTFRVLVDLEFTGGSVSAPERNFVEINSVWTSAPKDPHRPHADFRQCYGDLPFANMPLTSDYSAKGLLNGREYFRDLRPDFDDSEEGFKRIVRNIVQQILARSPTVPVISMVTHNDHDFSDPNDPVSRNYRVILEEIDRASAGAGLKAQGVTFERICKEVLTQQADLPDFVPV